MIFPAVHRRHHRLSRSPYPYSFFRPHRRQDRVGIVGPEVARVAAQEFLLCAGIGALPEAVEVLGDLDRVSFDEAGKEREFRDRLNECQ